MTDELLRRIQLGGEACPDHWHCDPIHAAHSCTRPDRTKPCPTCGQRPT